MKPGFYLIFLFAVFSLSACGSLTGRVSERPIDAEVTEAMTDARHLLSTLKNQNYQLRSFKGIGKIRFRNKDKMFVARMAWVGSEPGKLRLEVLGVTGQAIFSLASDGRWFYLISHTEDRFYKKRSDDASLTKLISVAVKSSDVLALLGGRVPVYEHDELVLQKMRSGDGRILVLKRWWGIIEKIYLDESSAKVQKIEAFDITGSLTYRAVFDGMQTVKGYRVPSKLVISNNDGAIFQLDIDRYWTDVSVSPSIFMLTPREKSGRS